MATGQYIGLFDHDDLLHPSALYEYMKVITERNADFIYCDENKFEKIDDKFFDPNFKPDFDLDYLRANNYICHFRYLVIHCWIRLVNSEKNMTVLKIMI